ARLPPERDSSESPAPCAPAPSSSLPFFLLEQPAAARAMNASTTTPPTHHLFIITPCCHSPCWPLEPARPSRTGITALTLPQCTRIRPGDGGEVELRCAAPRRAEHQIAPVRRPTRVLVAARPVGYLSRVTAVRLDGEDLKVAADARRIGDAIALRRP